MQLQKAQESFIQQDSSQFTERHSTKRVIETRTSLNRAEYRGIATAAKGDILIVDNDRDVALQLSRILIEEGYRVLQSDDADGALVLMNTLPIDAVIMDINMAGKGGFCFFDCVKKEYPAIPLICLDSAGTIESAVSAMTRGAFYFFIKQSDYSKLKGVVALAVKKRDSRRECQLVSDNPHKKDLFDMIGESEEMGRIFATIETVKDTSSNVLICGETGTGKELIAKALHRYGKRCEAPFVAVNCAAIPKELIEAELFGCEKGAFTGAVTRRTGKFEEAANGTIFLDELGELDLPMQAKLLRVLQEREIVRIGSNAKIKVGFRLVSATNSDLAEKVKKGEFREDLYYRVNVIEIKVPPLRERRNDIPALVDAFLSEFCAREEKKLDISDEVREAFLGYHWPGNVRQVRNVVERAVVLSHESIVTPNALPGELRIADKGSMERAEKTMGDLQIEAVKEALLRCKGNKSKAARMLNISRKAFYKKLKDDLEAEAKNVSSRHAIDSGFAR